MRERALGSSDMGRDKVRGKQVWYFAYGSNMKAESMTKRNITPIESKIAEVPSHYLTFDIFGIPFSEPSYASIESFPPSSSQLQLLWNGRRHCDVRAVCGIAYLLTSEDFHRLLITEGSGVVYHVIEMEARGLSTEGDCQETMTVYALKAKRPMRPNGVPSQRYMVSCTPNLLSAMPGRRGADARCQTLFRDGAAAMELPKDYRDYLSCLPVYVKPLPGEEPLGTWAFSWLWRPFLKQIVRLTTYRVDQDGNCPEWVAILIVVLYNLMWVYHDCVHRKVFTSGDGGKMYYVDAKNDASTHE